MLIKRKEESAHWYLRDGTAYHEVPNATRGGMRPATIRDAFKAGAYRSVTNVLGVVAKPGLDYWKAEQVVLAALTLPRFPDETEQEYAGRVIEDSKSQTRKAAEAGTAIHDACSRWLKRGTEPAPELAPTVTPFQNWVRENMDEGGLIASEVVALNHFHAYAGTLDVALRLKDKSIALLDMKTQDVKLNDKGEQKPAFYDEWAMQLAAYSRCQFADGSWVPPFPWRLFSRVIDRSRPGCWAKEWTDAANPQASSENYFQAFLSAGKLWSHLKGGTPGKDLKAA